MAVLRAGLRSGGPFTGVAVERTPVRSWHGPLTCPVETARRVLGIFTAPLPADVRDAECSVVILFRASQALNYVTGGRDQMTFSARCHVLGRRARTRAGRLAWRLTEGAIDASCGVLRGECAHCATAWSNYRARGRQICQRSSTPPSV